MPRRKPAQAPRPLPPVVANRGDSAAATSHWYDSIRLSAYAQAQLEFHQDSEDQLAVGGQPLNQNRFLLRRARLKIDSAHRYTEFLLELDGNTVKGPSFGVQRAEVSAVYRGRDADSNKAPLIGLTAGVLIPSFGASCRNPHGLGPSWSARRRRALSFPLSRISACASPASSASSTTAWRS